MSKDIVKKGYDRIAGIYQTERDQFKSQAYLEKLAKLLPSPAIVLDVGCGTGLPVDRFLVERGYRVIGIDISEEMLQMAKKNVPGATYELKDMLNIRAEEYQVDAVVSFYAVFHTPRETHARLFSVLHSLLRPNGLLLVTLGSKEWEGEESDFFGVPMWWSQNSPEANRKSLEEAKFEILLDEIDTSGSERHSVIMARKQ